MLVIGLAKTWSHRYDVALVVVVVVVIVAVGDCFYSKDRYFD